MILEVEMHGSKIRYQEIPKDSTEKLFSNPNNLGVTNFGTHPQLSWPASAAFASALSCLGPGGFDTNGTGGLRVHNFPLHSNSLSPLSITLLSNYFPHLETVANMNVAPTPVLQSVQRF